MRYYSSLDAGAPQIANANGSLAAVLRACLVGTAGVAYGSKAAAGWTEPYATASSISVFKQGAGGNNRILRVVDNGVQADLNYRRVNVRGYEAMTAISTGTGAFPTTGQISGNGPNFGYRYQSIDPAYTPQWNLYASSSFFHLLVDTNYPTNFWSMMSFGTFFSEKVGDIYNDVLMASPNNAYSAWQGYSSGAADGVWVARSDNAVAGAKPGVFYTGAKNVSSYIGYGNDTQYPYPNRINNALMQSQPELWVDGYFRGRVPGLWESHHTPAVLGGVGTTWQGTAGSTLAGKGFRIFGALEPQYVGGAWPVIETTDTWD